MNVKLLLGVMVLGGSATVLALTAAAPKPQPTSPVVAPKAEVAAPIQTTVQVEPKPAPVPAPTLKAQVAELQNKPQAPAIKVAAAAKPAPAPPPSPEFIPATARQLDALLAPIALYPDQLLSQILMASTYPLEVVEAARWAARPENEGLQGDRLAEALEQQDWDPSVKALVAFPHILKMMDSDLDWMGELGDAFLDQETEVMDSVQRLRREARDADRLRSDERRRVQVQDEQIIIEPANPEVVYVPFYDPRDAYGVWPYPEYPPIYIPPPMGYAYMPGVYYSYVSISPYWGWSRWDWRHRQIHIIDVPRYTYHNRGRGPVDNDRWRHDPRHRDGDRRDRDGRDRDGRDRPGNRPPQGNPPGGPVVQPNAPPANDPPPVYANRDPRRYRTPTTPSNTAPNVAPNVTPQLPAAAPVPALAPPVSTAPSYANRDPRRYRTPQADNPPPTPRPEAAPQLPATAAVPVLAPPVSTPAPQPNNFRRGDNMPDAPRANRLPRAEPRTPPPQQVYQAPPAMAPAAVAAPPPVMSAPPPSQPQMQQAPSPPPNFRRGPQPEASSSGGGDTAAPCNPRRGNCGN